MSHCTLSSNRGAIAIVAGFSLVLGLGFAALVIDIGYGLVVRNALQNTADGAALAAARELGRIYKEELPEEDVSSYQLTALHRGWIVSKATEAGKDNATAGKAVLINEADIAIGRWNSNSKALMPSDDRPDAVRVMARRDTLGNGPIYTFFASIIGRDTMTVTAHATAALSGLSYVGPGKLEMPVGISEIKFGDGSSTFCGEDIVFYPTSSCSGWTTFHEPSNSSTLDEILDGMLDGSYAAPSVQVGSTSLEFTGGNVASNLPELKALYDSRKDELGNWETTVAVYADDNCSNPEGEVEVVGFAKIVVTTVLAPPDGQFIQATIACNTVEDGRGGGSNLGVIGSIPNLVQ